MPSLTIVKASGEKDIFSVTKLVSSLTQSGASAELAEDIAEQVEKQISSGVTTREIYRLAFHLLRKKQKPAAARYSLKQAIMDLGPSGYPFEQLIGRVLEREGYQVSFPEAVPGRCVSHEVDVVAVRGREKIMVEAKFHNQPGYRSDIKTTLYVWARFKDLRSVSQNNFTQCWLMTNTKFTSEAVQYANCVGMRAIGWGYPAGRGFENMIEESKLHPLTVLTCLSGREKRLLLEKNIVVASDLSKNSSVLKSIGLKNDAIARCLKEIDGIMSIETNT